MAARREKAICARIFIPYETAALLLAAFGMDCFSSMPFFYPLVYL